MVDNSVFLIYLFANSSNFYLLLYVPGPALDTDYVTGYKVDIVPTFE